MKAKHIVYCLLLVFCLMSSFQCSDCTKDDLRLDGTRSWFPLKGKTHLTFLDDSGSSTTFRLRVVDTTEVAVNLDCPETYNFEYITTSLYLNPSKTDSIHFSLGSAGWLCMRAMSNDSTNLAMCNVFGNPEGNASKRFTNYTVGNRSYRDVFLMLSSPVYSHNIDSVIIANRVGIVGFKYEGKKYSLL